MSHYAVFAVFGVHYKKTVNSNPYRNQIGIIYSTEAFVI